jgi:carbon storage regulator
MLVIARRENEAIQAGDIEITVLSIRGNQVRLGIQAPDSVVVSRKELINPEQSKKSPGKISFSRRGR